MKVLELCLSQGVGGLELYVDKVIKHYQQDDNTYCYAVTRKASFLDNRIVTSGVPIYNLSSVFHHLPLFAASKLAKKIDEWEIDVLHMHWGKDLLLAILAKKFCRRRIRIHAKWQYHEISTIFITAMFISM